MAKDIIVVVQRDALPTEKESLDILLVSTTGEYPVNTYRDLASVEAVFGPDGPCPNSKIVRKVTTLLNQGKTTLADTLISKFKIVGFEPPSASPAVTATFAVTFAEPQSVDASKELWARIGGDGKALVKVTAKSAVTTAAQFAALFDGTSFEIGGKTYSGAAVGDTVLYTATVSGEADSIPERVEIFEDEGMTTPFAAELTAEFVNGSDEISAADNLVNAIKQFQTEVTNDWYYLLTDKDDDEYVIALAKFAEASEPTEAELGAGVEDHRKFYMGQTSNKQLVSSTARAAVIYTDEEYLNEEPDASYTGNVGPFYPKAVTWKFKRPQDGNANTSEGEKLISLPRLTDAEREQLLENHVNFLTEEYKRQYVKEGVCLNGEFIDVVLGGDWIAKRMRDLLYDIMLENANIDYDDAGFGLIASAVLQALAEAADDDHKIVAVDQKSRAGLYTVTIPKFADATDDQRRNRVMPDIPWEAQLSGAVHQVKTKGVLRVSL
jgi:hypothetical protein